MSKRLRVKLDLAVLVKHRSKEEGRAVSETEVFEWLSEAGFTRDGATHWIVMERDLGQVEPDEVLEVTDLD